MIALAAVLGSLSMAVQAQSKDQALLDALVRKGVLTEKEAAEISAETANEVTTAPADKIKIGDWVKELKLSGDLRIRNQADQRTPMIVTNPLLGPQDTNINRDRWRFRLRLNADFKLEGNFFGGVQLATGDNRSASTKNATYTGGYDSYGIYISRAFMGWAPTPALTAIVGKQANPFYTTDLIYDPEVDPQGLVERIDFDKIFNLTFGEPVAAEGKEGKTPAPPAPPPPPGNSLELSIIAGQFVFNNNNANSGSTQLKWDSYAFQEQLLATLKIGDKLSFTFGPGFLSYNDSSSGGLPGAHGTIIPPASVQGQTFDQTTTGSAVTFGDTLGNSQPYPVTQRDLNIILAPGDITYKIFGKPLSLYWDFAYNFTGDQRFTRDYGPLFGHYFYVGRSSTPRFSEPATPTFSDNSAWLVGLKYGENKKAGDFSASADYRQVGISSTDPNINSDNFALSNLNVQGWEFNLAYNFTDFLTAVFTLFYSYALHPNLYGGYATGYVLMSNGTPFPSSQQYSVARDRQDLVFQANLLMKF
ncbi:MAG: putative porin [Verrucomicrobia bacterium]|nr:putative porin [Verrucomicrobiota bacterium]